MILAIGFFVLFVGAIYFGVVTMMRSSEPYQIAVASAKDDPRVIQRIGTPITEGWLPTGSINYKNSSGDADIAIPISGPLGSATIYVVASKSDGEWSFTTLDCKFKGSGERLPLASPALIAP